MGNHTNMKRCLGCMDRYEDDYNICPHCGYVEGTEAEEAIHMEPGTILSDRYIIGRVLGYGGFGVTYIGWDGKLEQKVAIKEYLPSEFSTRMPGQSRVTVFNGDKNEQFYDGLKKFVEEAKRLAKFQNEPGIVKVFDSFIENDTAYIIMEYLDGETLASRLKREKNIDEVEAIEMLTPIMKSLQVVHEEGILHRDIAPDNIFITRNGEIKLIDFGASRYATTSHSRSLTVIIKPGYSPEEQYRSKSDQGPHTDVYALGACLYKMLTGKTPPDAMERRAIFESKGKDILKNPREFRKSISTVHEYAILNAMNVRIEDRTPSVSEFMAELYSDVPIKRKNGKIKKIDLYKWPVWFRVSVAMIVIVLSSTIGLMAAGVIKVDSIFTDVVEIPEGMVSVPLVEGIGISKAVKTAEKSKLTVAIAGSVVSEHVDAGKIVYQKPNSGLLCNENSIMYLYVSKGNGEIIAPSEGVATMPYVVGSSEAEAKQDLEKAGLPNPSIEYAYDDNVPEGMVMSQNKDYYAQLPENTTIKLVVSKGSEPFELSDYKFMQYKDVEKALNALNLAVEKVEVETCDYAEGTVISQDISAGSLVKKLDTIVVTTAKAVWSDWSLEKPNSANRTIESRTQYSYSDYETAVQTDNNSMSGWTLDSAKTKIVYLGDYSSYSDWSDTVPSQAENRIIENKTQYRYKKKEYTTSDKSSLSGWTKTNTTSDYTDYGAWSNWQAEAVSASDTRQVESRTVKLYYYYTCPNCGSHLAGWGSRTRCSDVGGGCSNVGIPNNYFDFYSASTVSGNNYYAALGGNVPYANTENGRAYGHNSGSTRTEYRYCDRTLVYTYTYERWSDFSKWSDNAVKSSDTVTVETKQVYRYSDAIPHYEYSFFRWTTPTEYSDTIAVASDTRKVTTRELYRYKTVE